MSKQYTIPKFFEKFLSWISGTDLFTLHPPTSIWHNNFCRADWVEIATILDVLAIACNSLDVSKYFPYDHLITLR